MIKFNLSMGSLFLLLIGIAFAQSVNADESAPVRPDTTDAWLLHVPGISGETGIDRSLIRGLGQGGYDGDVETYDWTNNNPGLAALHSPDHAKEAKKISDLILARARAHPDGHILLTSHSGGTGLLVWALEDLPDDVHVDTVLLLASALSPTYDLSKALSHVRGKLYAYTSPNDVLMLGFGTGVFGTIDGKKTDAAGRYGFTQPDGADAALYEKLIARPYEKTWMKYGNIGDHIGVMSSRFAAAILAPIVTETLPKIPAPATRPATQQSVSVHPKSQPAAIR